MDGLLRTSGVEGLCNVEVAGIDLRVGMVIGIFELVKGGAGGRGNSR